MNTKRKLFATTCLALLTGAALLQAEEAAPNTWVRVAGTPGPRSSFGLVYVPQEKAFVCFGGSMAMNPEADRNCTNNPYTELTLNLGKGAWENRFPKGKEGAWGEAIGPSRAPKFGGSVYAFTFKDAEGNTRPYIGGGYYNATWLWGNTAFDSDRGRAVMYWTLVHQSGEYDPVARTWELTSAATNLPQTFRDGMLFGAMCYEPINREVIGGQFEHAYKDGAWRKLELGSALINGLREKSDALRLRARNLANASRARYYLAESDDEARLRLDGQATVLARAIEGLGSELQASIGKAKGYEKTQIDWAAAALTAAAAELKKAAPALAGKVTVDAIHALDAVRDDVGHAVLSLAVCPPRRAHSRMAYDAANKKIVLFGGDALDRYLADTWVYDPATRQWEQRRPAVSPPPCGHPRLAYLPRSQKVLLIGNGLWIYDVKENAWQKLAQNEGPLKLTDGSPYPFPVAADESDLVVTCMGDGKGWGTYAARIDALQVDKDGTAKSGVAPLTTTPYPDFRDEPQWYETTNAPPPDAAAEEAWRRALPANTWTNRLAPNWPKIDYGISRCWGTCTIDTDRGDLLLFGGGHGTYDGNNVLHYSIRANRYYTGHRPEHTENFAPNGIGIPALKSYQGRPFVSCHAYHSYAYDPTLHKLVFCGTKTEDKGFTYDPYAGDWALDLPTPFGANVFDLIGKWTIKCISTPKGAVAWTGEGLWRVDAAKGTWEKLPGKIGGGPGWESGIAYDAKRERLLLNGPNGTILAGSVNTDNVETLKPAGATNTLCFGRENVYLPEFDVVLTGTAAPKGADGKPRWLLYDCAKNAWRGIHLPGNDPGINVSLGLMYDPPRKLVWAMGIPAIPHVLRLDLATADIIDCK